MSAIAAHASVEGRCELTRRETQSAAPSRVIKHRSFHPWAGHEVKGCLIFRAVPASTPVFASLICELSPDIAEEPRYAGALCAWVTQSAPAV